jgi:hypothetical protein
MRRSAKPQRSPRNDRRTCNFSHLRKTIALDVFCIYRKPMHTVVETPEYLAAAKKAGMSDSERLAAVDAIAANPSAGDVIEGSGGARKVRVAREGKGKSGGYRVITYYTHDDLPVYLLTVISKGKQANLTATQKAQIKKGKGK